MGVRQPIENSPPGIHTMPSGAGPGAGAWLGMVGAKAAAAGWAGIGCAAAGCVPPHHKVRVAITAATRLEVCAASVAAPPR